MDVKKDITVTAKLDSMPIVAEFIETTLEEACCSPEMIMTMSIATDEIFSNIARYAYANGGDANIALEITNKSRLITLTFTDEGKPFDPLTAPEPDITLSAEERKIGGLGIFMVKKMTDEVTYEYKDGKNILRVKKSF